MKRFATASLLVISILGFMLSGEVAIRIYHWVSEGIPVRQWHRYFVGNFDATTLDDQLGWKATQRYKAIRREKTKKGTVYSVELSQNGDGFRQFGDLASGRKKVMVVGDSFTHAREVSDAKTYYALLGTILDVEIFGYGVENYGTLQEYMILDRFIDIIQPDLIVWQYCFNDFANNDPILENRTSLHTDFRQRPYWVDGKIVHGEGGTIWSSIRSFSYQYSRFFVFLLTRMDRLHGRYILSSVESEIEKEGSHHPGFRRAVSATNDLMARVRARAGTRPMVAFNCKSIEPYNTALKEISREHGIVFADEVAAAVDDAARRGVDVFHADGAHWSEEGHRVVGEALARYLRVLRVRSEFDSGSMLFSKEFARPMHGATA